MGFKWYYITRCSGLFALIFNPTKMYPKIFPVRCRDGSRNKRE